MKPTTWPLLPLALAFCLHSSTAAPLPEELRNVGVTRGIGVVLGDPTCELAIKLAKETELLVYAQMADAGAAERARRKVDAAGLYGTRVLVESGPMAKLHLADNIADALVAVGEARALPETEALRVLHPQATAWLGGRKLVKPFPAGVDDWSHPYHGPDNNPLSRDTVARAPYLTQFLAEPRYAPLPQVAVASAGRVFKLFGHIAFKEREEPWLDTLAAFNDYNGTLLWRRAIPPALMVHRSTLIATPASVYFGDDTSCKIFDAATGEPRGEIAPPAGEAGGTFWKWMALEDGTLYALIGGQEERDPVIRARSNSHGWPWNPLSPGYNKPEHTWGFGRTLLAIDPATKRVLWRHREAEPMDSRALCMKSGRLFVFRFGSYLACLDAKTGRELWRKTKDNAAALFAALGGYLPRQDWRTNWRTAAYLKCSDQALYFAGPPVGKLLAVSTGDGRILWEHPYNNYQLVIGDDALYGVSGQIDQDPTRTFDPLTGRILAEIPLGRRACSRVTGSVDAIFCRAGEGSTRLDRATHHPQLISPMRAQCHDGVTIGNGLLYWWPSVCDCNLTLYGITCLGPAGGFDFNRNAVESERLERFAAYDAPPGDFGESPADWPAFRANDSATATTRATIPTAQHCKWQNSPATPFTPTAPTTAGGLVFYGGSDGIVRALDAATGQLRWKGYTCGEVRFPPTLWRGRAIVGSGDGYVYCFEAKTGCPLWRFRAAPVERRIPVYGSLQSTWPVAANVPVVDGVAYVAAGIVNYDGTHIYALDAATGRIKWQNNTSGHLDAEARTGVSAQGQMMVVNGRLYLAGGNAVSPAIYDITDGHCLNDPALLRQVTKNNVPGSVSPRGSELYRLADEVRAGGKPLYAHPKHPVYDNTVVNKTLLAPAGDRAIAWVNNSALMCFARGELPVVTGKLLASWGKPNVASLGPLWANKCKEIVALAAGPNAIVVAKPAELTAYDLRDGSTLWTQPVPAPPVPWGLAVNRDGCVIVTREGGQVACFGAVRQ